MRVLDSGGKGKQGLQPAYARETKLGQRSNSYPGIRARFAGRLATSSTREMMQETQRSRRLTRV